jgi:hypothetical protein
MIRSAFLKYSTQLRIGRMHGAFVTYHNTQVALPRRMRLSTEDGYSRDMGRGNSREGGGPLQAPPCLRVAVVGEHARARSPPPSY